MNKALRNPMTYILFVIPGMLLLFMFFVYPLISSLYYGFTNWNGISDHVKLVGFRNFSKALSDPAFWSSVKNNGYFILFSVFIQVPITIVASLMIANVKKLQGLYKTAIFMPTVMSTAVIGILWGFIYNYDVGLLNKIIVFFGGQ